MAHRVKKTAAPKISDNPFYWVSIVLSILGALDAIYLLVLKYTENTALCGGSHGCITVNSSSYSQIGVVPIAAIGLLGYLAILGVHLLEPRLRTFGTNGPLFTFGMALTGVAFSAYLTYLELYVIFAICPFCVASAVIVLLIFIVAIIRLVKQLAS